MCDPYEAVDRYIASVTGFDTSVINVASVLCNKC